MKLIVAATKNKGKIREIQEMTEKEGIPVRSMEEMGVSLDVEETGTTFEENALLKARAVWEALGEEYLVIADDSGLEIDFFDGRPGIYSSRWLGEDTPYEIKNRTILEKMKDVPEEKRGARYVCAIAAITGNGREYCLTETLEGQVAFVEKGQGGFGYDPIIWLPEQGRTVAELLPEEKNALSHRGKALRKMEQLLRQEGVF